MTPGINERALAQIRPTWDASIAESANSETFQNISTTLGQLLAIPAGCTGITIYSRSPGTPDELFVYMAGGVTGTATFAQADNLIDTAGDFVNRRASIGDRVRNLTDGSIGVASGVAATNVTIVGGLSGGTDNDWEVGDEYRVETILGPRIVIAGGASAFRGRYFAIPAGGRGKPIYVLGGSALVDVDVFYHFD